MSQNKSEDGNLRKIRSAEELIEKTLWDAARQQDRKVELRGYEEARKVLETLPRLRPALEKEKNRVLSFCLMRIDDALTGAGDKTGSVARMKKALEVAERSEDDVTIARCLLALGARLASAGQLVQSEEYWNRALSMAENRTERDMQQVVGWTGLVKARFLSRAGKTKEALETLNRAEQVLESINNYAGVADVDALMAEIYGNLKDAANEQKYREKSKEFMEKSRKEEK